MILVDTSILIGHSRAADPVVQSVLHRPDAAVCGVIRAEMLHGARTPADALLITAALDALDQLPIPEAVWQELGTNLAQLRRAGITVPFQDALIATVAIYHDAELWTADAHFIMIRTVLPALKLFIPPSAPGVP